MSRRGITQRQFNKTITMLKDKTPISVISKQVGLTERTIQSLRQAGTYEEYSRRRELKARRASADRAMHPAPRPEASVVKRAQIKEPAPTTWGQAAKDVAGSKMTGAVVRGAKPAKHRVVGVQPDQSKHGVTEQPISAHVLQDAYRDAIKRNDELAESLKRNSDILSETLGELRLIRHRFEREDREQTIRESRERQQKKIFGFRVGRN